MPETAPDPPSSDSDLWWLLDDATEPAPAPGQAAWSEWLEQAGDRTRIAVDIVGEEVRVTTVFLGVDRGMSGTGLAAPVLFETLILGGRLDGAVETYSTRAAAVVGHDRWLALVRAAM